MALGPLNDQIMMYYYEGLILLYIVVHLALCLLHNVLGIHERSTGENVKLNSYFGWIKTAIFSSAIIIVGIAAISVFAVDGRSYSSYSGIDDVKL